MHAARHVAGAWRPRSCVLAALAAKSLLISVPRLRGTRAGRVRCRPRQGAASLSSRRPAAASRGFAGDDLVRARLVAELQQMGLKPIVRDQFACNGFQKARLVACARVRNVIAVDRAAGRQGAPAQRALRQRSRRPRRIRRRDRRRDPARGRVDPEGPPAATARHPALQRRRRAGPDRRSRLPCRSAQPQCRQPAQFRGARRERPGDDVRDQPAERRGDRRLAAAVRRPFASSLSTDVARLIPNDTDVTTYKERGWLTLNFAIVGNETRYHSPGDDLAGLDPRSLQHMGDQALAVASKLVGRNSRGAGQPHLLRCARARISSRCRCLGRRSFAGLLLLAASAESAGSAARRFAGPRLVLGAIVVRGRAGVACDLTIAGFAPRRRLLASASGDHLRRDLRDGAAGRARDLADARRKA